MPDGTTTGGGTGWGKGASAQLHVDVQRTLYSEHSNTRTLQSVATNLNA